MRVCVLGAGITGLATAWQLQTDGHDVTIIDQGMPGEGASRANGAQLSYAYVQPLASGDIWASLPKLLSAKDSPLTIRLDWDLDQWRWGLSFLLACRAVVSRKTTMQLLSLAEESRRAFTRLISETNLDCDFSATGKLVVYQSDRTFGYARAQLQLQQSLGVNQYAVSAQESIDIEPSLERWRSRISGAIFTPGECAADCYKVCLALMRSLSNLGARSLCNTSVKGLVTKGDVIRAVRTYSEEIPADAVVVALGAGSATFGKSLGISLPVYPLKGYSVTLPALGMAPRVSVTDAERKIVFANIGGRLRVAGGVELVGYDMSSSAARIACLLDAAEDLFGIRCSVERANAWVGQRPATPTGIPILGTRPDGPRNLIFNTGHGGLGFTLAFGRASRIAALLRDSDPSAR